MNKIYISEAMGAAFWLEGDTFMYAPLHTDDTFSMEEAGEVEVWDDCDMTREQLREKLS